MSTLDPAASHEVPGDTPRPDALPLAVQKPAASPALHSLSTGVPLGTWRSSATSSPSPDDMGSAAVDTTTPFPHERSRLGQVLDLFRRRASSSIRATHIPVQSLKDAREQAQRYIAEVEHLHRRLEATEAELASRDAATKALEATNCHAQELLKRNNELELMIAQIQDESDVLLGQERKAHQDCRVSLRVSADKVEDLSTQISLLRSSKATASHSTGVAEELKELKLSLTQHEIDMVAVKAELEENRSFANDLQRHLESERNIVKTLQSERKTQLESLSNIGGELDVLLRENKTLDLMLADVRKDLDVQVETHRLKMKEAFETSKSKDQKMAELKLELETMKSEMDVFIANVERLKIQNLSLQQKSAEYEAAQLQSSQLTAQLAQSEERRRLEQTHYDENLNRIKTRLHSLEGVQQRATDLLTRNSELEQLVAELRKKITLLSKIPEGTVVKQLKEKLQSKSSALTGAHETVRAQAADIKLLEKSLDEHRRRLHTAEIAASRNEQPKNDGPETRAWQQAVEKVMAATRDDARREMDRVIREYDSLVKSIREAHSKELEQREAEFQARVKASESDLQTEQLTLERQRDLESQLQQTRHEIQTIMLRKDQEIEVYKKEFERSFTRLQSRKLEEIRDQLNRKEEQVRKAQEEIIIRTDKLRDEYETQIEQIKRDHDLSQLEKDKKIGQLQAELVSLKEKMVVRERELEVQIQKEGHLIAERMVEKYKKDFDAWLENQKRDHEREVGKVRDDFRLMMDEAKRENDRLRLENEMDVSNLRRDHENRMATLRTTLNELVDQATLSLKDDLTALKEQLTATQSDRNKISEDNIRLGRELNRLRAGVDERDAEVQRLQKQQRDLEALNAEHLKEIQAVTDLATSKTTQVSATSETYDSLLSRNSELEEIIAAVSEKYHDELKTRMENSANLTRTKLEFESKIRSLNVQIEAFKMEKQGLTTDDSVSETRRSSLEARVGELAAQLAQLEGEKQQMIADLEVERTRVQSLRQQLSMQSESNEERRRIKTQLIQKIKDIAKLTSNWDPHAATSDPFTEMSIATEAEKKRLEAEVGSLKNLVLDRQKTIAYLETSLKERLSDTTKSDQLAVQVKQLQSERQSLVTETKLLEASLKRQEDALQNEIKQRDIRLKKLTGLNETLSTTLQRNSELEVTVQDLLRQLHRSCDFVSGDVLATEKATVLMELVEKFEEEFRLRTVSHEDDLKALAGQLDEREIEISRLQMELRTLKGDLEANHSEQLKSQRVQFESKIERLKEENSSLLDKRAEMETDLEKIRQELAQAKENGTERVNKMVADLTEKLKDHQLAIAEIANEKELQTQQYETMLKVSKEVQAKLKAEIDKVSAELAGKENDILELTKAIKEIMQHEGIEDAHLDGILKQAGGSDNPLSAFTGDRWTSLMGTLESLFFRLSKSQHSAKSLMSMLNALLKEQQESLQSIAASQAAAIQNHTLMSKAVSSDIEPSTTTINIIKPSFAVTGGDLSLVGDGLASLQSELRVLKATRKSLLEPAVVLRRTSLSGGSTTARTSTGRTEDFDRRKSTNEDVGKGKRRFTPDSEDCEMNKRARLTP